VLLVFIIFYHGVMFVIFFFKDCWL